jgi:Domain of unknown function (DUF397)
MVSERGPPWLPAHEDGKSSMATLFKKRSRRMKTFLEVTETADLPWQKSTRSGAAGHCVQLAAVEGGVALGHSKDEARGAFVFSADEIAAFIAGVKLGEFDHLV